MSEKTVNSVIVSVRMPTHLREKIKVLAKQNGRTFNAELNYALEIYSFFIAKNPDASDSELVNAALSAIRDLDEVADFIQQLQHRLKK